MPHLITENLPFTVRVGWTAHEFKWLFREGFLNTEAQLELIEGDIWVKPFQESAIITSMALCVEKLRDLLANNFTVRTQQPLLLGEFSQPEPDISVVAAISSNRLPSHHSTFNEDSNNYSTLFPTTAELVIEFSNSTLRADQTTKAALYARAHIAEYWIVNLVDRTLEVRRQPSPMEGELLGHGYRSTQILLPGESIAPLGAPNNLIGVDELLP